MTPFKAQVQLAYMRHAKHTTDGLAVAAVKVYALPGEPTGCEIEIREATG